MNRIQVQSLPQNKFLRHISCRLLSSLTPYTMYQAGEWLRNLAGEAMDKIRVLPHMMKQARLAACNGLYFDENERNQEISIRIAEKSTAFITVRIY